MVLENNQHIDRQRLAASFRKVISVVPCKGARVPMIIGTTRQAVAIQRSHVSCSYPHSISKDMSAIWTSDRPPRHLVTIYHSVFDCWSLAAKSEAAPQSCTEKEMRSARILEEKQFEDYAVSKLKSNARSTK